MRFLLLYVEFKDISLDEAHNNKNTIFFINFDIEHLSDVYLFLVKLFNI